MSDPTAQVGAVSGIDGPELQPTTQVPQQTGPVPTRSDASIEPAAIASLALALVSVLLWIGPAIIALFLASGAKRNIENSNGLRKGKGFAIATQVIAWVLIVLEVAALALIAAFA